MRSQPPDTSPSEVPERAAHDGSTIVVREARTHDLTALIGLLEEIMAHHGVSRPPLQRLQDTLGLILGSPTHIFLVAEREGILVGACSLVITISTWSAGPVCEVQDVIVTEASRRAGIGRRLLAEAGSAAAARGCVRLFLNAEPANLAAHAFYRSLGLQEKTTLHFERSLSAD